MMPLLRRTQPIGRNDIREKATRLQVRHLATKPRHLLRCASNMMTVKQAQAQGTSLPLCRSCRDKLGHQSTGESAETATRDALEENRTCAKNHSCFCLLYKCKHALLFCQGIACNEGEFGISQAC